MAVRGAPAIAIAAALALATDLYNGGRGGQFPTLEDAKKTILENLQYLSTSRPTAVNLFDMVEKFTSLVHTYTYTETNTHTDGNKGLGVEGPVGGLVYDVIMAAEKMLTDDIADNKAIGSRGVEAIRHLLSNSASVSGTGNAPQKNPTKTLSEIRVMTHCNTGALATAGHGTALGIIRDLHSEGILKHVYCTETRPYNQGSRLTAYELVHDSIPATLIADSAAASLLASGAVDVVIVGADRVAANGDTANKIGTFSLAVNAHHNGIPFIVAAPTTTVDKTLRDGSQIHIELRDTTELTHQQGVRVAAPGIEVYNPSFDVTPGDLISAIVTESAAHYGAYDFAAGGGEPLPVSASGFHALDVDTVAAYVAGRPNVLPLVGSEEDVDQWKVSEVGDGNINYVYIIEGPKGAVILKQGLPHIRIDPTWMLEQDRSRIEALALKKEFECCPEHVPALYHFDLEMCVLVMQYLVPPHDVLRRSLVKGREMCVTFENIELCRLTEDVIFTNPYFDAPSNRHTKPYLDEVALKFRNDDVAKAAVFKLKSMFLHNKEALLHGDLHTGSWLVAESAAYAIDPEFAFVGPMAFDLCKMTANLLIAYLAADGLAATHDLAAAGGNVVDRSRQKDWILETICGIWRTFEDEFLRLWSASVLESPETNESVLCPSTLFAPSNSSLLKGIQAKYVDRLFHDSLSFAGAVIIRRVLGIAHVIDFEKIDDDAIRSRCELKALTLARRLLIDSEDFTDMASVCAAAAEL